MAPNTPSLTAAKPPPPIELTAKQAKLFEVKDECDEQACYEVVRVGETLVQYNYDPLADPPPKIIVHDAKRTRSFEVDSGHDVKRLIPSPSGARFIIMSAKGGDGYPSLAGGHAVEVEVATLHTEVAITGTTGRTGYDTFGELELPTVDGVDYVGDDDTLVATTSTGKTQHLVLLQRDPGSRRFAEVSRIKVRTSENQLATSGELIATSGAKSIGLYRVDGERIVKLAEIARPSKYGTVFAYPADTRRELWLDDQRGTFRLTNLDGAPAAAAKATKPAESTKLKPAKPAKPAKAKAAKAKAAKAKAAKAKAAKPTKRPAPTRSAGKRARA